MLTQPDADRCTCELVTGTYKSIPVTAWSSSDEKLLDKKWKSKNTDKCGSRREWVSKSQRHGYKTLEDKYRFQHHEDLRSYIEEYTRIFSVAVRCNKKGWQQTPPQYKTVSQQQFYRL